MPKPDMPINMRDFKPKRKQVQRPAGRYFPGKAPEAAGAQSGDEDEEDADEEEAREEDNPLKSEPSHAPIIALKNVNLQDSFNHNNTQDEIQEDDASSAYETDKEDDASDAEEDDDSSEEEESSAPRPILMKPTFIPKSQRQIPKMLDALDDQERRKQEARKMIEDHVRQEALQKVTRNDDEGADCDDTDDLDPAAERAAWRLRELLRIKREKELIVTREAERAEVGRRRAMPAEERLAEDMARIEAEKNAKGETKIKFMQKYYHKGAFFQDEEILQRDYTAPVNDDVADKTNLPKIMQVRGVNDFGKKGATRWTHLTNEDTSVRDSAWSDPRSEGNKRVMAKMGGLKDPLDHRSKKPRM